MALVLLLLSATFDVIDHRILQMRLQYWWRVTGSVPSWIKSSLSDRLQHVGIGKKNSESKYLDIGVPQGSVLGQSKYFFVLETDWWDKLPTLFALPLLSGDAQVYIAILPKETWFHFLKELEAFLTDISNWMGANILKLNQEKRQLISFNPTTRVGG